MRDEQATSTAVVGGTADADFGNWWLEIGTAHGISVEQMENVG